MLWAMSETYYHLVVSQTFGLDLLAGLVCFLAAYTALSLAVKPAPAERIRYPWLIAAGVAAGAGGWAAYLILLLGFQSGVPFAFELGPTAVALGVGTVGSFTGLFVARRTDLMPLGGAIVGFAIAAMFYVGMMGIEFSATRNWNALYVTISVILGASFGAAALARGHLSMDFRGRLISSALLSAGIMSTCLVGLSALDMTPDPSIVVRNDTALPVLFGISLTAVVMLIASLGIVGALIDRYVAEIELAKHDLERTSAGLAAALKAAEAANEVKARFLANMSHELRTPLNAIIGFSDVLKNELLGPLGEQRYREYASDIGESGGHLLHLVNDILELSKVDAGQIKLFDQIIDLNNTIAVCVRQMNQEAERRGVLLSAELDSNLSLLRADEHRLRQIVLNLLSNAIKFTPSRGQVCVSTYSCASGLAITIADTGIGMTAEEIPVALTRFGQIDNRLSRRYEGAGLGLPLAKHLAELHGATLDIESERDVGTKVTVMFPVERIHYAQESMGLAVA
jgi:signal transduction histidine kinase